MKWFVSNIHWIIGFAGVWTTGNGILHDIFVLAQKRPYERELIRLLIDGHLLIFSGVIFLLCYKYVQQGHPLALWICFANSLFLLTYCALIFKILPAVGMILINIIVLVAVTGAIAAQK